MAIIFCTRFIPYHLVSHFPLVRRYVDEPHLVRFQFNMKAESAFHACKLLHKYFGNAHISQILYFRLSQFLLVPQCFPLILDTAACTVDHFFFDQILPVFFQIRYLRLFPDSLSPFPGSLFLRFEKAWINLSVPLRL